MYPPHPGHPLAKGGKESFRSWLVSWLHAWRLPPKSGRLAATNDAADTGLRSVPCARTTGWSCGANASVGAHGMLRMPVPAPSMPG